MSLFHFGKKKEERKEPVCVCKNNCLTVEVEIDSISNTCCGEEKEGIYCIKVLGTGCKSCHTLLENTEVAVKNKGLKVEVEYVTEMEQIMKYGVMSVPVLVVNEKVVSMGKILSIIEIETLFQKLELS